MGAGVVVISAKEGDADVGREDEGVEDVEGECDGAEDVGGMRWGVGGGRGGHG